MLMGKRGSSFTVGMQTGAGTQKAKSTSIIYPGFPTHWLKRLDILFNIDLLINIHFYSLHSSYEILSVLQFIDG